MMYLTMSELLSIFIFSRMRVRYVLIVLTLKESFEGAITEDNIEVIRFVSLATVEYFGLRIR